MVRAEQVNGPAVDVVVLGAGPAGVGAAVRLASIGRSVTVVDRPGAIVDQLVQHLPTSGLALFEAIDMRTAVEEIATCPDRPGELLWAGVRGPMVDRGRLIERRDLRRLLADRLTGAGVCCLTGRAGAPARDVRGRWSIPLVDARVELSARVVIDATGRTPRWAHRTATSPPTVALCVRWRSSDRPAVAVHALEQSWVWAAASRSGIGGMSVEFVDACDAREDRTRRATLTRVSDAANSVGLEDPGDVVVRPATSAYARRPAIAGLICVGDAASALDPLTSHGVVTAVRSGLQGAVVANTMLDAIGDDEIAQRFLTERTRASHLTHVRRRGSLYADQAVLTPSKFWRRRAGAPVTTSPTSARVHVDRTVSWAADASWLRTGVIVDELVVERESLHHPSLDSPMAFIAGQPASLLRTCFRDGDPIGRCLARAAAAGFGRAAMSVAVELLRHGILLTDDADAAQTTDRAAIMSG